MFAWLSARYAKPKTVGNLRVLRCGELVVHRADTQERCNGTVRKVLESGARYLVRWDGSTIDELYSRRELVAHDDPSVQPDEPT